MDAMIVIPSVGMKVVCVDDDFTGDDNLGWSYVFPKKGETYTIRAVEPHWEDETDTAIRLEELVNVPHFYSGLGREMETHFKASRFRPAIEPGAR